ncbi:MAG: hypothetical protein ABI882_10470 [Acidobacteriota bacterium]
MATICKLIAVLTTLATTGLLAFESARHGALVVGTILGIVKIVVFMIFGVLLVVIAYLLLTTGEPAREKTPQ